MANKEELISSLGQKYEYGKEIEEKLNLIEQQLSELEKFKSNLATLDESKEREFLASLGKGVFIKSEIMDKILFVDVGSGVLIKKTTTEAKEVVEDQMKKILEIRIELQKQIELINRELQNLIKEIEKSN